MQHFCLDADFKLTIRTQSETETAHMHKEKHIIKTFMINRVCQIQLRPCCKYESVQKISIALYSRVSFARLQGLQVEQWWQLTDLSNSNTQ